jgi:EAL domain-containing protein (putative c-di-GMP-specific phosphodiesterase class I)
MLPIEKTLPGVGRLSVFFQPIIDLTEAPTGVHSLEALVRGSQGSRFESADRLFGYVRRERQENAMDRTCFLIAIRELTGCGVQADFSINVHASTLADPSFTSFVVETLAAAGLSANRLIFEIVEHSCGADPATLRRCLDALRRLGVRIALDDVGQGFNNCQMILQCRPDFLKVDRYFVHQCRECGRRRAVIESVAELGDKLGAEVIAEGLERDEDLDVLRSAGVRLAQGYLFSPAVSLASLERFSRAER